MCLTVIAVLNECILIPIDRIRILGIPVLQSLMRTEMCSCVCYHLEPCPRLCGRRRRRRRLVCAGVCDVNIIIMFSVNIASGGAAARVIFFFGRVRAR